MSRTILTKCNGFTPLITALVKKYGLVTAAVFGRVWWFCQYKNGVCHASIDTIAEDLKLNRYTVMRHIETLLSDGFLEDKTPELRNKPHIYVDTGRAQIISELSAGIADDDGVIINDSTDNETPATVIFNDSESHLKPHPESLKMMAGVINNDMNILIKRDLKRDLKIGDGPPPEWSKFFDSLRYQLTNGSAQDRLLFRERLAGLKWGSRENGVITLYAASPEHAAWLQDRMTNTFENWFEGYKEFAGARVEFIAEQGAIP